ncbi:MAG: LD-carboxypeptidase [Lachnospiraceae bacterium]|nr:LD-carboxypeptidase [Lachnospiraceae bacterium]
MKIALVCCSNGLPMQAQQQICQLMECFQEMGIEPVLSPYLYATDSVEACTARQRAETLMGYYRDPEITDICDVSGGDIANEILPYLDYKTIATSDKMFWGYSDLTTILNAIYGKTGKSSVLYQVRNLVREEYDQDRQAFADAIGKKMVPCGDPQKGVSALFAFEYEWIQNAPKQGEPLQGIVAGGNIRCLLKLAGTPYWPDMTDKILLLEARSGGVAQMTTYLSQLQQMGVFEQVRGVLLGNFTQMEREQAQPGIVELVCRFAEEKLPVARTAWIGHGADSRAIAIGMDIILR